VDPRRRLLDAGLEEDAPEVAEAVAATLKVVHRLFMPGAGALWKLPLPATRRFDDAIGRSDALIYGMIRERRTASGQRPDVLSALIRAGGGNGQELDDRQVRDELVTLLFGAAAISPGRPRGRGICSARTRASSGGGTTRSTVSWPGARRPPTTCLASHTRALFWEALRLCPPGWVFVREVARTTSSGTS
jgi:epi-isozizaene 5-monooxygenase / beta-farnesene synthase